MSKGMEQTVVAIATAHGLNLDASGPIPECARPSVRRALVAAYEAGVRVHAPTYTLLFLDDEGTAVTVKRDHDGKECSFDTTRNPLASFEERKATALAIAARMAEEYWQ